MELFKNIVVVCSGLATIIGLICLLVKPIRKKLLGDKDTRNGLKCLLRSDMLRTYYKHRDENKLRQYEFESFMLEYSAYKAMGGNSFIDKVKEDVKKMEVLS